ncbi:MAG: VOC family protein [Gemmatimonadetes bacterium]|nr:VOC family protein [Gemmatimonadota bacterium]
MTTTLQNPFGLHTVTPYLVVHGVEALLGFAQEVFGAELRGEPKYRENDTVQHVEILIGDSVIMMGEPMGQIPSLPASLYIYVDDCDAAYERALRAGAASVLEPTVFPHGDRYGGVRDASGNIWWIATHVGADAA